MDYFHVITDAKTGEVTQVPFTPQEIAEHEPNQAEQAEAHVDPVEKLKLFLNENPDVALLLGVNNG